jgi:hypothetical protein
VPPARETDVRKKSARGWGRPQPWLEAVRVLQYNEDVKALLSMEKSRGALDPAFEPAQCSLN